jgi:hypothetical protein
MEREDIEGAGVRRLKSEICGMGDLGGEARIFNKKG